VPQAYDLVVIGAGTGGYVAAIRAAQLGLKTAVVERQKSLGGTCLLWGCIPTKALLEHAHALKIIQHAADWGRLDWHAQPGARHDAVHARKDKIVTGLTKGVECLFKKNKIDWIKGTPGCTARVGRRSRATRQTLRRKQIIVATGSSPRSVPGITIDPQRIITSDEAIHLQGSAEVDRDHGQRRRRRRVRLDLPPLRQRGDRHRAAAALVPVEDEAVSAELEQSFKKQGITR
jgi:dihydrolipoamide dehydrogenase